MKNADIIETPIRFHKVRNAMERSAGKAPYLAHVDSPGVVEEDQFIGEMLDTGECTESADNIRRIIRTSDNVIGARVGEHVNKVVTDCGTVVPHVSGSLPKEDAEAGEENAAVPRILPDAELRNAAADIVPVEDRSGIDDLGGVRILSVYTEGVGFSLVKGTLPFRVAGLGFKPSETSTAALAIRNPKTGVETAVPAATVDSTQRINAQLSAALPAGNYQLIVTVTEGGEGNVPRSATANVKAIAE